MQFLIQFTVAAEYTNCFFCRGVTFAQRVSCYDSKQSDGKAPVMLELWGMQSTPSLPSVPGPLGPGLIAPHRVQSMGQKELSSVLMLNGILFWFGFMAYQAL